MKIEFYMRKVYFGMKGMIRYDIYMNDTKIDQRVAKREYMACLVRHDPETGQASVKAVGNGNGIFFGRPDLIGKGESRHYIGKPGIFIARVRED